MLFLRCYSVASLTNIIFFIYYSIITQQVFLGFIIQTYFSIGVEIIGKTKMCYTKVQTQIKAILNLVL